LWRTRRGGQRDCGEALVRDAVEVGLSPGEGESTLNKMHRRLTLGLKFLRVHRGILAGDEPVGVLLII
jgi:hypothetical protein